MGRREQNKIDVPYNYVPYDHQLELYDWITPERRRALIVWHRRSGKDKTCFSIMAKEAYNRVGSYYYVFPEYGQAKKVIWEGMDDDGFKFLHHIPPELVVRKSEKDLNLTLTNGSIIQLAGTDNYDSLMGTNPVGVVFSEYSLQRPEVWDYFMPILIRNNGWAIFNGTPRGRNHFYDLYSKVKDDPGWYVSHLSGAADGGTGLITDEMIEQARASGMTEAAIQQEFFCAWDAAMTGAYYKVEMELMQSEGRLVDDLYWDRDERVHTAWDLGMSDSTAILFFQVRRDGFIDILDMIQSNGKGLDYYVREMERRPYLYGYHLLPHDVKVRELGASGGRSRRDTLYSLGLRDIRVVSKHSLEDGINQARRTLARVRISQNKCSPLTEALRGYRAKYDPRNVVYGKPVHDRHSHLADAFRMLANGYTDDKDINSRPQIAEGVGYNPLTFNKQRSRRAQLERPRNF